MKRNIQTTERKKIILENRGALLASKALQGTALQAAQAGGILPSRTPAGGSEAGAVQSTQGTQIHLVLRWGVYFLFFFFFFAYNGSHYKQGLVRIHWNFSSKKKKKIKIGGEKKKKNQN